MAEERQGASAEWSQQTRASAGDVESNPRPSTHLRGPYYHNHDHENEDYDHDHHHWLVHRGPIHPSRKFTGHQIFYLFALDGFGAFFISGGINFAIAYGESPGPFASLVVPFVLESSRCQN